MESGPVADMALTALGAEALRAYFELPESAGFVLAGGAGLVAAGMSQRPTEDLDLFTSGVSVEAAGDALENALAKRGWRAERISKTPTYPPIEWAARKLLALFGRAALRDFIDVTTLAQ